MSSPLEAYKPAASSKLQLLLAALLWSTVGVMLVTVGDYWLLRASGFAGLFTAAIATFLGLGKSLLVLDRTADRLVTRIKNREGGCIGGVFSLKTWALVAIMAALGRLLRSVSLPSLVPGLVYTAVGSGLLISSRRTWKAWQKQRRLGS